MRFIIYFKNALNVDVRAIINAEDAHEAYKQLKKHHKLIKYPYIIINRQKVYLKEILA